MIKREIFPEEDVRFLGRVKYLQTTSGEGHLSFGITTEITKLLASPKTQSYNLNFLTAHMTIPLASALLVTWHSFPFTKTIMMVHGLNALVFNCYSRILWEHLHLLSTQNVINNPLPCILSNLLICHAKKCYLKHSWSFQLQNIWAIVIAFLNWGKWHDRWSCELLTNANANNQFFHSANGLLILVVLVVCQFPRNKNSTKTTSVSSRESVSYTWDD